MTTLLWLRRDLRLDDNPALAAAVARGEAVVPLFILDPDEEGEWQLGGASRWWLHHSLHSLGESFRERGSRLILRTGETAAVIAEVIKSCGVRWVVWNQRYEPAARQVEGEVERLLVERGVPFERFHGSLLKDPVATVKDDGTPYKVYGAFKKAFRKEWPARKSTPAPKQLLAVPTQAQSLTVEELDLLPRIRWDEKIAASWEPGEAGAHRAAKLFLPQASGYAERRNTPSIIGTSRLSPSLHFGEISPARLAQALVRENLHHTTFADQLLWREFAYQLLYYFPHSPLSPLRSAFERFPWKTDTSLLRSWQRGTTGYPIVDAGMRELWSTGWMHNRVRMIVGSFLVKDLLQPWQEGARWFWDTLVDADLAANTLNWQWVAGCGVDAAPYFRIFNPTLQGERFDQEGSYVKRWCPELSAVPTRWIHKPFAAPPDVLSKAGVRLGETYPAPVVDHGVARDEALAAYQQIRERGPEDESADDGSS